MTCGIYEIKNNETNKVYIGQSVNIEKRWQSHLNLNPINTSQNLMPSLKLAKQSSEMDELNMITFWKCRCGYWRDLNGM